jgi:hypothetical protein
LVTLASFASGALLSYSGWEMVQLAMAPALLLAAAALMTLVISERRTLLS